MKVILAEKPSVARDLAAFLKVSSRRDGFIEGNGYQITWAFGHLVELCEPGEYDEALKRWTLASLPFVPDEFKLRLRRDEGAKKQFAIIKKLFRAADSLICATDAGREGELIFRYIQTLTQCTKKPAQRLWLSSLTSSAIGAAFRSIRPLADYDNLYAAAKCRSEADWVVGINATRNYTVRYRSRSGGSGSSLLWSLGRVQTPVLAMIVHRDDDIRTFKPEPFWELATKYRDVQFNYTAKRFDKQEAADETLQVAKKHLLQITKITSRVEKSQPPQLYDLTELQRDMNRRYGISAADTLAAAQSLYEAKLITYPRTDSRYLSKDMRKDIPNTLEQLRSQKPNEIGRLNLNTLSFTNRIINDAKITDHHAIIPTGTSPVNLRHHAQKVYDAILIRFIAAFYPQCEKQITTIDAQAGETKFQARGTRVVISGWTELYPRNSKDETSKDDPQSLPEFIVGESGPHKPFIKDGQTSPPKHFTENTLLGAMDTAGRFVEEPKLREALKEKGLGTPATRAATIETLLTRKYINRDKKNITATDLGRYLIAIVKDRNLTSPELTGEWEAKLKKIEAGGLSAENFMQEISAYAHGIIDSADAVQINDTTLGPCPCCGEAVIAGSRAYGCSHWREGCKFVLQPEYRGIKLSMVQIRELLQIGVINSALTMEGIQPFLLAITRTGNLLEIPLPHGNEQGERSKSSDSKLGVSKRSPKSSIQKSTSVDGGDIFGVCPQCKSPIIEQPKSFSCSRWREGCGLTIWKTMAGKKISATNLKKLLQKGETPIIKGFKSKAGKSFDAKLKLTDGKVQFDF